MKRLITIPLCTLNFIAASTQDNNYHEALENNQQLIQNNNQDSNVKQLDYFIFLPQSRGKIFQHILKFLDPFEKSTMTLQRVSKFFYNQFLSLAKVNFTTHNEYINFGDDRYISVLRTAALQGNLKADRILVEGYALGVFGIQENRDLVTELSHLGSQLAQTYSALDYQFNSLCLSVYEKNKALCELADLGCKEAQSYCTKLYASQGNKEMLLELADRNYYEAQDYVAKAYAYGIYGIEKNKEKIIELAERGWIDAQNLLAEGYARGLYGFDIDVIKLNSLANKGVEKAQYYLAEGFANGHFDNVVRSPSELLVLERTTGWKALQSIIIDGYANGTYGFSKDENMVKELANKGWVDAQNYVAYWCQKPSKQKELLQLASLGWEKANYFVTLGYAHGQYGFNHDIARAFLYCSEKNFDKSISVKFSNMDKQQLANLVMYDIVTKNAIHSSN